MISVLWWRQEKWLILHLFSFFLIWMRVMTPKFLTHQTRNWKFDSVVSVSFLPSFPSPLILFIPSFLPSFLLRWAPSTLFLRQDFAKVATGRITAVLPYYSLSLVFWGGGTHELQRALSGSLGMSLAVPESPKFRKASLPWTWLHFTSLGHIKMDMLEPGDGGCPKIPRPSYPCQSWCPLLWRLQPFPWPWLLRWSCGFCGRGDNDKWQWRVMLPSKGSGVLTSCYFSRDWRAVVLGEISL